jgi:cyclopropane fatty-acyl-phospholipid synthase-like methyltransferase
MIDGIALVIIFAAIIVLLPYIFFKGKDAPFVPMDKEVVERVMNLAEVGPKDVFYDLGSGDGRLVIAAALRGAKAVGIEISHWQVWYSQLWVFC